MEVEVLGPATTTLLLVQVPPLPSYVISDRPRDIIAMVLSLWRVRDSNVFRSAGRSDYSPLLQLS